MCIAILKPGSIKIPESYLINSYQNNSDGCGFAYIRTDLLGIPKLVVEKTMDFNIFLKKYNRAFKNNPESHFLIHFRIATHGTVDKFNCHPFKINKNLAFIHNGVITGLELCKERSDTQVFNDTVLKKLPKEWEKNKSISKLIEKFIGVSKLVTLDINGEYNIYNEKLGHWNEGCWFSNKSYIAKTTVVYNNFYKAPAIEYGFESYYCEDCGKKLSAYNGNYFSKKKVPICLCDTCKVVATREGW